MKVRTDTLQSIFHRHLVPITLDLMVIDVEGGEEPIVSALLESLSLSDEPVVCKVQEALDCFLSTQMDVLVLGDTMITRDDDHGP
jgi:Carbamoyltransferase C-terminus